MAGQQCPICGNPIPDWAHEVCYACSRMRYREPVKLWKPSVRPERKRYLAPLQKLPQESIRQEDKKYVAPPDVGVTDWRKMTKEHVDGLSSLLYDIYGRNVRISQLMIKSGIPFIQIEAWRKRKSWILSFLLRFEDELSILLVKVRPGCNSHLLKDYYIDGLAIEKIAQNCKQPIREVAEDYRFVLEYLKSPRGITELERIVVKSTRFQLFDITPLTTRNAV